MCILLYNICSKCYCGYPRFTETCPYMHPPLIYCPRSTQFKFRIVGETECHLHPHHAPLLHIGADGNDTVLPVHQSGSGPVIEAVSQIPYVTTNAGNRVEQTGTDSSIELPGCPTLSQVLNNGSRDIARNGLSDQQGGYHTAQHTSSYNHSIAYSRQTNGASWNQANTAPAIYRHPNYQPAAPSPFHRYHTNTSHSRAPFDSKYQADSSSQYRFYPHQAAPVPPFRSGSGSTPPGCVYLPVYGPKQYAQYQGSAPSTSFRVGSNQTFPEHRFSSGTSAAQSNWNANQRSSFNPQATAFESNRPRDELRQSNLEQLQRSNDAAYYNTNGHGSSQSVISDGANTNKETSSPLTYCRTQAGDKSRSRSESYPRQPYMGDIPSSATQERRSLSYSDHPGPHSTCKGKEVMQTSSPLCAQTPPLSSSPQNAMFTDVDNDSAKTESSATMKQESDDEYSKFEDGANWSPVSVKTDPENEVKLRDIPLAPATPEVPDQAGSGNSEWNNENRDSDSDNREWPDISETPKSDVLKSATTTTHKSGPTTKAPARRLWSAVVSGKYAPSSNSFPAQLATKTPQKQPINTSNNTPQNESLPKTWAGLFQDGPGPSSSQKPEKPTIAETDESDGRDSPPRAPPNTPTDSNMKPARSSGTPNSIWEDRFSRDLLGSNVVSPASGSVSVVSDDSATATVATAPSTVSEAAASQTPRPSTAIPATPSVNSITPALPRQSGESLQIPKTTPRSGAATPTPSDLLVPKPRLWSQVLGGSNSKTPNLNLKPKSDGDKDESDWPSLGSRGLKNERKRNTYS
ncbi:hypothetical protein F5Y10DRAFT_290223 [Nemania abortiva]|nr:hypothetical protein F5Y10DRAFT_290223 [Nemania abortiva]